MLEGKTAAEEWAEATKLKDEWDKEAAKLNHKWDLEVGLIKVDPENSYINIRRLAKLEPNVFPPPNTEQELVNLEVDVARRKREFFGEGVKQLSVIGGAGEMEGSTQSEVKIILALKKLLMSFNRIGISYGATDEGATLLADIAVVLARKKGQKIVAVGVVPIENVKIDDLNIKPEELESFEAKQANSAEKFGLATGMDHVVLVDSDDETVEKAWGYPFGEETPWRVEFDKDADVVVLINGGNISVNELVGMLRNGKHVVVVKGSGRLADIVANQYAKGKPEDNEKEEPDLDESTKEGKIEAKFLDMVSKGDRGETESDLSEWRNQIKVVDLADDNFEDQFVGIVGGRLQKSAVA